MRNTFYILLAVLSFYSCSEQKSDNTSKTEEKPKEPSRKEIFDSLVARYPVLTLPLRLKINGGKMMSEEQFEIATDSKYSVFFKDANAYRAYGKFDLPNGKTGLISVLAADDWVPVLGVYDAEGTLLSSEYLVQRGCHEDCGYIYCASWLEILPGCEMTLSDTLDFRICDENGKEGAREHFTLRTYGKVDEKGRIRFSEGETIALQ